MARDKTKAKSTEIETRLRRVEVSVDAALRGLGRLQTSLGISRESSALLSEALAEQVSLREGIVLRSDFATLKREVDVLWLAIKVLRLEIQGIRAEQGQASAADVG